MLDEAIADVCELFAPPPAQARRARIYELGLSACRWPVGTDAGEHLFCGERRKLGKAYCAGHLALAYIKPATTGRERRSSR